MLKKIKMFCCIPYFALGAAVGIVTQCIIDGYEWGREEFFWSE